MVEQPSQNNLFHDIDDGDVQLSQQSGKTKEVSVSSIKHYIPRNRFAKIKADLIYLKDV
jgi:hypothetical protein